MNRAAIIDRVNTTACQPRRCDECGTLIRSGDAMQITRETGAYGDIYVIRACSACAVDVSK